MSLKPACTYCLHIVLSAYILSLGLFGTDDNYLSISPKVARATSESSAYYVQAKAPIVDVPEGVYSPFELIVHFKEGHAPHELEAVVELGHKRSQSLFGKMRTILESLLLGKTPYESAQEHLQTINALDAEFEALERSRMFDGDVENLSQSYIIRFPETVDLDKARLAYENLEEVSYVQYNFIYSLSE